MRAKRTDAATPSCAESGGSGTRGSLARHAQGSYNRGVSALAPAVPSFGSRRAGPSREQSSMWWILVLVGCLVAVALGVSFYLRGRRSQDAAAVPAPGIAGRRPSEPPPSLPPMPQREERPAVTVRVGDRCSEPVALPQGAWPEQGVLVVREQIDGQGAAPGVTVLPIFDAGGSSSLAAAAVSRRQLALCYDAAGKRVVVRNLGKAPVLVGTKAFATDAEFELRYDLDVDLGNPATEHPIVRVVNLAEGA